MFLLFNNFGGHNFVTKFRFCDKVGICEKKLNRLYWRNIAVMVVNTRTFHISMNCCNNCINVTSNAVRYSCCPCHSCNTFNFCYCFEQTQKWPIYVGENALHSRFLQNIIGYTRFLNVPQLSILLRRRSGLSVGDTGSRKTICGPQHHVVASGGSSWGYHCKAPFLVIELIIYFQLWCTP